MLTARNTFSRILAASATSGEDDGHHRLDRRGVERHRHLERRLVDPAHHLGDRLGVEAAVARVLALGREGQEEVLAAREAARLEARQQLLARGAGIGGRLEHHQLARPQPRRDLVGRLAHVGEVGLAVAAERRRHAHQDRVALGETIERRGGLDPAAPEGLRHALLADVADVRLAALERPGLVRVDVEAGHREAALLEEQRERQPDVAEPDHADPGLPALDPRPELDALLAHTVGDASTPGPRRGRPRPREPPPRPRARDTAAARGSRPRPAPRPAGPRACPPGRRRPAAGAAGSGSG